MIPTRQNNPEEHNPCAIIITMQPNHAVHLFKKIPAITMPIWATEEYAIKDYKSVCRMQIKDALIAPNKPRLTIHEE